MCMNTTPHTHIHVTDELLDNLYEAQKNHLIYTLQTNRNGDDGGDYISSATDLFAALQQMTQDQSDTRAAEVMLNSAPNYDVDLIEYLAYEPTVDNPNPPTLTVVNLSTLACDGICDAIYQLQPRALEEA